MSDAAQRLGLVVRDSYLHGNPTRPIDPGEIEAERAHLSQITGWDIRYLHYDRMANDDPMFCHAQFLEAVEALKPVFIWYRPSTVFPLIHRNLRPEVLYAARALFGARLIFSFGDLATPFLATYVSGYAAIGDVSVASDGNAARLAPLAPGAVVLDLWPCVDPRIFRDPDAGRDIDVCFAGSRDRTPERRGLRAELPGLGVSVVARGEGDGQLSVPDYVGLLNRSKISLNFSQTKDGAHQIKARVIESILSGALLFESENGVTSRYLSPYRHYVPFSTAADLATKIRRYLTNDPGRRAIVAAAKAHVAATLSERIWWRRVLEALGGR